MFQKIRQYSLKYLWLWPLLAALAARFYKLTASSIWHDEGYTMWLLRYDFAGIIDRTVRDVHPPGYYLLAKPWVMLFGDSVFSIRFFSLIFSVGIVWLIYRIVKEIWSDKAAFWASTFVALSPFMVRFGQEARMYGVVAFFTTLATYALVKYIKDKNNSFLWLYLASMIVAVYTQYYAFFVVISHWLILSYFTDGFWKFSWISAAKEKVGVLSYKWWLTNAGIVLAYLPWFPVAYKQVTRISGNYWIRPEWINYRTIPNNVLQFSIYSHLDDLYNWNHFVGIATWVLLVSMGIFGGLYIFKDKKRRQIALSLFTFGFLPMLLVYTLSKLKTPVYQDRYFPFSAVAIFTIWGVAVSEIRNNWAKFILPVWIVAILIIGNLVMHQDVNHQMLGLSKAVRAKMQPGDKIYSGELYTFLDGSYYFGYGDLKFISDPVDGFGESSLFYDQQAEYVVTITEAQQADRVWVIGKTGDKDYFNEENWHYHTADVVYDEGNKANGLKAVLFGKQ